MSLPGFLTGLLTGVVITNIADAAAAAGGFIGFGLGAMPVDLAVMRGLSARYGDAPRAMLAITLAASLFPDTANALALTALFAWLGI
ncbi:MAG: hypothetical protein MUF32_06665 [Burkholderiaceae bacterium]|jgi:ESS family glutamate:Na+ symporter|nr:hypothetical protein [Burkholderiaceae bacterium]